MKITRKQLKGIIQEECKQVLEEQLGVATSGRLPGQIADFPPATPDLPAAWETTGMGEYGGLPPSSFEQPEYPEAVLDYPPPGLVVHRDSGLSRPRMGDLPAQPRELPTGGGKDADLGHIEDIETADIMAGIASGEFVAPMQTDPFPIYFPRTEAGGLGGLYDRFLYPGKGPYGPAQSDPRIAPAPAYTATGAGTLDPSYRRSLQRAKELGRTPEYTGGGRAYSMQESLINDLTEAVLAKLTRK